MTLCFTHVNTCTHLNAHTSIHGIVCVCVRVCVRAHTHTYTRMCTHTHMRALGLVPLENPNTPSQVAPTIGPSPCHPVPFLASEHSGYLRNSSPSPHPTSSAALESAGVEDIGRSTESGLLHSLKGTLLPTATLFSITLGSFC